MDVGTAVGGPVHKLKPTGGNKQLEQHQIHLEVYNHRIMFGSPVWTFSCHEGQ